MSFEPHIIADFLAMYLGEKLGSGIAREVYDYKPGSIQGHDCVVKVEVDQKCDFQNVAEYTLWEQASPHLRKFLAPVFNISPGGRILIMAKCEPCPKHLIPAKFPSVLRDLHEENIGLFDGKPVAMDYGRHIAATMASNSKAMRALDKAETTCFIKLPSTLPPA